MVINRNRSIGPNMYAGARKSAFKKLNKVILYSILESVTSAFYVTLYRYYIFGF